MLNTSKNIRNAVLGLALGMSACPGFAEIAVIVSAKSPISSLRVEQVAPLFLGQSSVFPNGVEAVPIDQSVGAPVRDVFHARVTRKSGPLLRAHWSKLIFTGRGHPPKEAPDDAAVKKLVAENPNFIGYIDKDAVDASVKAVLIP
ncbi:MAG: phosphate transporter substrate-binding protein [Paucimonas sp.]|jgi:hypothetical protein|nr:phosphate transporter substrate-binding protein [Paucimonas sp.]